jgi:hypothetical protein
MQIRETSDSEAYHAQHQHFAHLNDIQLGDELARLRRLPPDEDYKGITAGDALDIASSVEDQRRHQAYL